MHQYLAHNSLNNLKKYLLLRIFVKERRRATTQMRNCTGGVKKAPLFKEEALGTRLRERADHYTFLGNCPPTPPLSQH